MKLRLHGTRAEVTQTTRRLVQVLEVVSVWDPYPDRGARVLVRVDLQVRLEAVTAANRPEPGRHPRRTLP